MGAQFDELRSRRKPREQIVEIPLDEDLLARIDHIVRRLGREEALDRRENRPPVAPRLRKELEELRAEAVDAGEEFVMRELPMPRFRALMAGHPDPDKKLRWNEDTFGPALLEACCVSHDFTVDQWATLWQEWPAWLTVPLFTAAYEVCEQPSRVPFGNRSFGETRSSETSSTTAPTEG